MDLTEGPGTEVVVGDIPFAPISFKRFDGLILGRELG